MGVVVIALRLELSEWRSGSTTTGCLGCGGYSNFFNKFKQSMKTLLQCKKRSLAKKRGYTIYYCFRIRTCGYEGAINCRIFGGKVDRLMVVRDEAGRR